MSDTLRFQIGTANGHNLPNGRQYIRLDIGGLRLTLVAEPNDEPAPGAVMSYSVWSSQCPKPLARPRRRTTPQPEPVLATAPPAEPEVLRDLAGAGSVRGPASLSAKARVESAALDIRFWHGPLVDDDISDLTFAQSE